MCQWIHWKKNCAEIITSDVKSELQDSENVQNEVENKPQQKRFKAMTDSDIDSLEGKHQSTATKKNTQWGVNLFQGMFLMKYCLQIRLMKRKL